MNGRQLLINETKAPPAFLFNLHMTAPELKLACLLSQVNNEKIPTPAKHLPTKFY